MLKKVFLFLFIIIAIQLLSAVALKQENQNKENGVVLSKQFSDTKIGFRFNYPERAEIYESSVNGDRWIRVFIKGVVGPSCDLSVDTRSRQEKIKDGEVIKLGSFEWTKTRADRGFFGGIYDSHGARWRLNSLPVNFIWDTRSLEYEPLCERIINTFNLEKS